MENLSGIVSTIYDLTEQLEEQSRKKDVFTGPQKSTDSVYMTVQKNIAARDVKEAMKKKGQISKNRFLKIGAITAAGLVIYLKTR